jgi:hypothetical protein
MLRVAASEYQPGDSSLVSPSTIVGLSERCGEVKRVLRATMEPVKLLTLFGILFLFDPSKSLPGRHPTKTFEMEKSVAALESTRQCAAAQSRDSSSSLITEQDRVSCSHGGRLREGEAEMRTPLYLIYLTVSIGG